MRAFWCAVRGVAGFLIKRGENERAFWCAVHTLIWNDLCQYVSELFFICYIVASENFGAGGFDDESL